MNAVNIFYNDDIFLPALENFWCFHSMSFRSATKGNARPYIEKSTLKDA